MNNSKSRPHPIPKTNAQRTADRAARAAGTIYRVAAGTESFDLNFNKQAPRSAVDNTDTDNDNYDSTSRKLTAGLIENGVIECSPNKQ